MASDLENSVCFFSSSSALVSNITSGTSEELAPRCSECGGETRYYPTDLSKCTINGTLRSFQDSDGTVKQFCNCFLSKSKVCADCGGETHFDASEIDWLDSTFLGRRIHCRDLKGNIRIVCNCSNVPPPSDDFSDEVPPPSGFYYGALPPGGFSYEKLYLYQGTEPLMKCEDGRYRHLSAFKN